VYEELKDQNFIILSVAFDTGGVAAVKDWIRPPAIEIPQALQDIMGWDADRTSRAAAPSYPCLIDEKHVVAELYDMVNVPTAVWINEAGRIVRPAEAAGVSDGFRKMDRTTWQMPGDLAREGKQRRTRYVDALRDWVQKGEASRYALSPDEVRRRMQGMTDDHALAAAHFRLGQYLYQQGHHQEAQQAFAKAKQLHPGSWNYIRQSLELEAVGKASGPEFLAALDALGDKLYYPPVNL
jgi:tetratricopeptide (TPR) repeat protein